MASPDAPPWRTIAAPCRCGQQQPRSPTAAPSRDAEVTPRGGWRAARGVGPTSDDCSELARPPRKGVGVWAAGSSELHCDLLSGGRGIARQSDHRMHRRPQQTMSGTVDQMRLSSSAKRLAQKSSNAIWALRQTWSGRYANRSRWLTSHSSSTDAQCSIQRSQ
jgi:hypothetical protein